MGAHILPFCVARLDMSPFPFTRINRIQIQPPTEKKVVFWSSNQAWIRVNGMFEYIVNDEIHDIHPFSSCRIYSNIPCTSPCFCTVPKTTIFHAGPPFVHGNERTYLLYGTQYIYTKNPFCTEDRLNNYFAT